MQYLGEFLSPTNSISQDQDKLIKYFYFRPDKYENPDADLENIFIIKNMEQFPKRKDLLSLNELYAVDNIEVNKRLSDELSGVVNVSYVVTATYDLLTNINKRENSGGGGGSSSDLNENNVLLDDLDNLVTKLTPPWRLRAKVSWQPIALNTAFTKAWYNGFQQQDVVNAAGNRILAETQRYQLEITYVKSFDTIQRQLDAITSPLVNSADIQWTFIANGKLFTAKTLLILPPSCQLDYWQQTDDQGNVTYIPYYTYTIKLMYDPQDWDKKLLNMGNRANFGTPGFRNETIYQLTVSDENGQLVQDPTYTNAAGVIQWRAKNKNSKYSIQALIVNLPLPLTSGGYIYTASINDPVANPCHILRFAQFDNVDFSYLYLVK